MKKTRLFTIITLMVIVVFTFVLSSPLFKLKTVEITFLNTNNKEVSVLENKVYNTQQKVDKLINSANFNYGSLVFLIDKTKYITRLENNNPYLKLINISTVFPNKLIVFAKERESVFCIQTTTNCLITDSEFKILEITKNICEDLLQIRIENSFGQEQDYYSFFNVLPQTYETGQTLTENNLVFNSIKNTVLLALNIRKCNIKQIFSALTIKEQSSGLVSLNIKTNNAYFGLNLQIDNLLDNFDKKFNKLINALNTLYKNERIKTTYGTLLIDKNYNCYWNNL